MVRVGGEIEIFTAVAEYKILIAITIQIGMGNGIPPAGVVRKVGRYVLKPGAVISQ